MFTKAKYLLTMNSTRALVLKTPCIAARALV